MGAGQASRLRAYQQLLLALGFFIVVHVIALPALALLVQPGFDHTAAIADRAAWISDHPWLWRMGWVPWQLSALSDIIFSVLLIRWVKHFDNSTATRWAWAALGANLLATIPEQFYEAILVTSHVGLASDALADPNQVTAFEDEQQAALVWTSVWGASWYIVMTIAWHRAMTLAARLRGWTTGVAGKLLLITCSFLGVVAVLVAAQAWSDANLTIIISMIGGIGFLALIAWSFSAADLLGQAQLHTALEEREQRGLAAGVDHTVVWPTSKPTRAFAWAANSRGIKDLVRPLPFLPLQSDIDDVVYLNWLVPTAQAQLLLPDPLRCDDLDGQTAVSVLTYRHGDFGPGFLGPLRRVAPSPAQSNWRLYLEPVVPDGPQDAIYFFRSVLNSHPHVALSRILVDGLPAHRAGAFDHVRTGDAVMSRLDPGDGSSCGLTSTVVEADSDTPGQLPPIWAIHFQDWPHAVEYLFEQNRGVLVDEVFGVVRESCIEIPIDVSEVRPATVTDLDISALPAGLQPPDPTDVLAFVVPHVPFKATGERIIASALD